MEPFCFVHAADLHLDSPFQGLREIVPEMAQVLYDSTFNAFANIVDLCINREADFLLIAGDVFDSAVRSLRAQIRFKEQLERLTERDISTFVVYGNHDHAGGWQARLTWPERVHFFSAGEVEAASFVRRGKEVARIHGYSYPRAEVGENLAGRFKRDRDCFNIGLLHCNVGNNPVHGNYAPCSLPDLLAGGMDYWALGHVHTHARLHGEVPLVVYPGTPQGRHPGETGDKGCCVVNVNSTGSAAVEFVGTGVVYWHTEPVNITALSTEQELLDRLQQKLNGVQERYGTDKAIIVRLLLEGRGPLHKVLNDKAMLEELLLVVRRWTRRGLDNFIWPGSIVARTMWDWDIDFLLKQDDIPGDFLRLSRSAKEDPALLAELRQALAPLTGSAGGRRHIEPPSDTELLEWLNEAEELGIRLLLSEEQPSATGRAGLNINNPERL